MRKPPRGTAVIDALGNGANDLHLAPARRFDGCDRRQRFICDLVPTHPKMLGDVSDSRPFDFRARVVPPETCARRMFVGVVAVAAFRREIDPSDERHAIVDHDRLLVVTVERAFLRVEAALDARVSDELVTHLPNVASRRAKERKRRSGPDEHTHVDAFGNFGEKVPKHDQLAVAYEREVR